MGSFWSFPQPPPSKHLSWAALAVMPAILAAFIVWELFGLDRWLVEFIHRLGW
jgi:hypothetical protein